MSNNGGVYTWSKTGASNATADTTVNFQEGQAPSSLNDSSRNLMASVAKWRDDISGVIATTGISVAYIVASNQIFDTLADFHGQMIAFTPHVTNGAGPVTVTVDGFANLPLRSAPGVELPAGVLVQGTPYVAMYNNTDGALYLRGFYNSPYNIPLLGGMDFWDTVTPNSAFIFPAGQAISRTVYAKAFARWGTTFGAGDGTTTFNVPDKTGRASVMLEAVATRLPAGPFGANSTVMGAAGGNASHLMAAAEIASHSVSGSNTITLNGATTVPVDQGFGSSSTGGGAFGFNYPTSGAAAAVQVSGTVGITASYVNGSQAASPIVQPSIVCNYIIRVL